MFKIIIFKNQLFKKFSTVILSLILIYSITACNDVATPPDTTPPETPQNFVLIGGGDGQARFRWTKVSEPDFQFYRIYRSVNSINNFVIHIETVQNEYLDRFLSYDSTYYYYLVAVDFAENESEPTYIIDVQPLNISAPQPPSFLIANAVNNPVENRRLINLSWLPPDAGDLDFFRIYKGTEPNFEVNKSSLFDSTNVGTYFDNFVQTNKRYFYKITAVDVGKKESLPSNPGSDLILPNAQLVSPSNLSKFTAPFKFEWSKVDSAVAYKVFIGNSPFSDIIWESEKVKENEVNYNGADFISSNVYYWWVGAFSREKIIVDKTELEPNINSFSQVGSFIGE